MNENFLAREAAGQKPRHPLRDLDGFGVIEFDRESLLRRKVRSASAF